MKYPVFVILFFSVMISYSYDTIFAQAVRGGSEVDKKVTEFLRTKSNSWHEWNVPESDGRLLYDIIVKNKYKNAVEIGTSTGHSGIWIAWALSKTGGRLTTIEIDQERHKQAIANFKKAGVDAFIDARLADAQELVPKLKGPVDFVFSDADKDWYIKYFQALDPKMPVGGCFTAHNAGMPGVIEYYDYISKLRNYKTTIDRHGAGMIISYKTGE